MKAAVTNAIVRPTRPQPKLKGMCRFRECHSACCRRFLIYAPKGRLKLPDKEFADAFLYEEGEFGKAAVCSRGEFGLLLQMRNIRVTPPSNGYYTLTLDKPSRWRTGGNGELSWIEVADCKCRHLTPWGACKIHARKPNICKEFPRNAIALPEGCSFK